MFDEDNLELARDFTDDILMSKIAWTVIGSCTAGDHWHVSASLNGGANEQFTVHVSELTAPLTAEEMRIIIRYLLRGYADGKTMAQVKSGSQLGVTVTI